MALFIRFLIVGFVLYVLWKVAKPRWHFKIVVKPDAVEFDSGIPDVRRRAFDSFFLNDLKPPQQLVIFGRRETTGRLVTLIKGTEDEGLKQQIRNFLMSHL